MQSAANDIINSMPKQLASIVGPVHALPFAIQCHHATLHWLAQARGAVRYGPAGPAISRPVGEDIYGDTLSNARGVRFGQHAQRCRPVVDHRVLAVWDLRHDL